ncbi:MAG: hypothetical protein JWM27_4432 [Gemmatimonadetes bacterium]|nr:hypothetical protein [Gemmatimonadota bacterium]
MSEIRDAAPSAAEPADAPGATLRDRLDRCQGELVRVRRHVAQVEMQHGALAGECEALRGEAADLARLYVACLALHGTLDRARVLAAVEDLMVNLVASEEFGVYERGPAGALSLARGFGIDARVRAALVPAGPVARALASGEPCLEEGCFDAREPGGGAGQPVACIPLAVDGQAVGAAVVWSFLPQKAGAEPGDEALYALLGTHVAVALRATAGS